MNYYSKVLTNQDNPITMNEAFKDICCKDIQDIILGYKIDMDDYDMKLDFVEEHKVKISIGYDCSATEEGRITETSRCMKRDADIYLAKYEDYDMVKSIVDFNKIDIDTSELSFREMMSPPQLEPYFKKWFNDLDYEFTPYISNYRMVSHINFNYRYEHIHILVELINKKQWCIYLD